VEATVAFDGSVPKAIRVFDAAGREVPSQTIARTMLPRGHTVKILFVANVPSVSLTVFDVRSADQPFPGDGQLSATTTSLENEHYRVRLNDAGDVASIFDKRKNRELLAAPAQLEFTHEKPANWPAWNMDWEDRKHDPIDVVDGPAKITLIEDGPVRATLEVQRASRDSLFTQRIRLSRGSAGRRVEFVNTVDWQSAQCALKASFPLTVSNEQATYNWGMGTIERANNDPVKYEVPSHEWFDLTNRTGNYGVTILEDCKFGSDKPTDNQVRLTLLYTPGVRHSYLDQHSQDWGRHDFTYALFGHSGNWRDARSEWQGRRLNQPLSAFTTSRHPGRLGRSFSLLNVSTDQVDVRAIKQAEASGRVIVRTQELWGRSADRVAVGFHSRVVDAYEVDGQERRIGEASVQDGKLVFGAQPYRPRSFAVRLDAPPTSLPPPRCVPVVLPLNEDVVSADTDRTDGQMDSMGRSIPAEMLGKRIVSEGITFELGPTTPSSPNAMPCDGQTIPLPTGRFDKLYLLAAATEDTEGTFRVDDAPTDLTIQKWTGFVGQWDDRQWDTAFKEVDHRCEGKVIAIKPGYIKRDPIAWFCTHRHDAKLGNEAYQFSYLFKYAIDMPEGATSLTLPANNKINILAASVVAADHADVRLAAPLYDDFTDRAPIKLRHVYPPPAPPIFQDETPVATVKIDRQSSFDALSMGPPVAHDFADAGSGNGIVFRFIDGHGDFRPHSGSGIVDGTFPRLNDGQSATHEDDTQRCVWYDNAGRFFVDLGKTIKISRINTYSWHRSNRAPQFFSLWGSNEEVMPDANIRSDQHPGWTLIAVVDTRKLGEGGVHGSSIGEFISPAGSFRHLLWAVEDMGLGTFFTEIDIHARPIG